MFAMICTQTAVVRCTKTRAKGMVKYNTVECCILSDYTIRVFLHTSILMECFVTRLKCLEMICCVK